MRPISLILVFLLALLVWAGCAAGPIPKEDIIIPVNNGAFLKYPAGGFSGGIYLTPDEMKDPVKFRDKVEAIKRFMRNRSRQKQGGCFGGQNCG